MKDIKNVIMQIDANLSSGFVYVNLLKNSAITK